MSRRRLRRCLEEWQVQARLHAVRKQRAAQAGQLRRRHLLETGFVSWWVCVPVLVWTLPGCCLKVKAPPAAAGLFQVVNGCAKTSACLGIGRSSVWLGGTPWPCNNPACQCFQEACCLPCAYDRQVPAVPASAPGAAVCRPVQRAVQTCLQAGGLSGAAPQVSQAAGPAQEAAEGQAAAHRGCLGPPHWLQGSQAEGSAGCCCSVPASPAGGLDDCSGQSRQRACTSQPPTGQGGTMRLIVAWPLHMWRPKQALERRAADCLTGPPNSNSGGVLPAGQGLATVAATACPCAPASSCRAGHLAASASGLLLLWLAGGGQAPQEGKGAAATKRGQAQHEARPPAIRWSPTWERLPLAEACKHSALHSASSGLDYLRAKAGCSLSARGCSPPAAHP